MNQSDITTAKIPIEIKFQAVELLVLIVTIVSVFLWCRSDAKDDYRQMQQRTDALIDAMRQDIRDFHARLCVIEERNRGGNG